ncbi:MAG: UTP--glucose-1-phosphate uridylyltransferase [Desulfomonile tiedjei]|nr:UTP--glucose-1-phosphate uridylyltransferase [Desulfomonile tiedjei]
MTGAAEDRIRRRMEDRGVPRAIIESFLRKVEQSRSEPAYVPLESVCTPDADLILREPADSNRRKSLETRGEQLLQKVVVVKLNGGRSTTMDGRVPKGILQAKDGLSYIEIIVRQIQSLREKLRCDVKLALMNSFFTHARTMEIVERFDVPVQSFMQNQVPRLFEETLQPLDTGTEEDWVPPGHGDVYESLRQSGLLDELRERGYRWAFISNLDNLAASVDPWIVGLIEEENIHFLLEVTDRTPADRKGGTLVVRNGNLDLLEIAQVAPDEKDSFMDIDRFRVFNTNNVWVDLDALAAILESGSLRLPLIQNRKRISGTRVVQIETAMGAAISRFQRARGLRVSRERFFPTKQVADLFVLQSDACILDSLYRLQRNPARPTSLPFMPTVSFGADFLSSPLEMPSRFEDPASVSLVLAHSLEVRGPAFFERDVRIEGRVRINAQPNTVYRIPSGTVLRDAVYP